MRSVGVPSAEADGRFRALVAGRYGALLRTAFLLTGDRGHAEDLVQVALLKAYEAVRRGADPQSLEAYTRTAMLRLALRWRGTGWRSERPVPVPDAPADGRDPVQSVLVRRALMSLPRDQRAVLVLRYFEDLSENETATALGVPAGTVKSRTSRALTALRRGGLLDDGQAEEASRVAT
jgi:RNA polymerase sigma-70 factor (sigma-E family)